MAVVAAPDVEREQSIDHGAYALLVFALPMLGSALLEAANAAGVDSRQVVRLGLPDRFVEHAERPELLAALGLDADGICAAVRAARPLEGEGAIARPRKREGATARV